MKGLSRGAVLVLLVLVARPVLGEGTEPRLEYKGDRLTARFEKAPLMDVLQELGRATGAQIRGEPREQHEVSVAFADVPLHEGIQRLLGTESFILKYGVEGHLRTVQLLGKGQPPPDGLQPAPAPPPPGASPAVSMLALFVNRPPIPVTGRLATALGSDSATFQGLIEAAMHQQDPLVRADAVGALVEGIEGDAELRGQLVTTVNGIDDAALGDMVRGVAGTQAEDLMRNVMARTKANELRVKAIRVLQRLRQPSGS